jgi:hypothetical protein
MKALLAKLALPLLLAACAPKAQNAVLDAGAPPSPSSASGVAPSYEAAFAALGLTKAELPVKRTMSSNMDGTAKVEGRKVRFSITAGWNGEQVELAKDREGRVVRIRRRPVEQVREQVIEGCQSSKFAGGRQWFEDVEIELPEGVSWGGEVEVRYSVVREVTRYTGKTKDGKPCPPPQMMLD